jgi:hypothetical protein
LGRNRQHRMGEMIARVVVDDHQTDGGNLRQSLFHPS